MLLRLLWRSRKNPAYRYRWTERLGYVQRINSRKSIWLHAVSLGESIAATPLIQALIEYYPQHSIVITTTTPTGSAQIVQQFGNQVYHIYAPYDLPHVIKRFIQRICPVNVIIMETELWPNLLDQLRRAKIPVMIANARLSERSFQRYQYLKHFFKPLLQSICMIGAQSKADGKRFQALGVEAQRIMVTGNIKFDIVIPSTLLDRAKQLRQHWQSRPTFIAASTHEGEESQILGAFTKILQHYANALLILVPRHPDRFDNVKALCLDMGYSIACRSKQQLPHAQTSIYLGDTTGELLLLYAASDIAFVGGSLVPVGGHNLIEPASLSLPIISGPHLENFSAVRDLLYEGDGLMIVQDTDEPAKKVIELFTHVDQCHQYGARALSISDQNRGAVAKHLTWIKQNFPTLV